MSVLLDTYVLSELRHPKGNPDVRRAVEALDSENLFLSIITTGEIRKCIALLTDSRRKRGLQEWFLTLQRFHADRVLSIDLETAKSGENSLPPHNSPVS